MSPVAGDKWPVNQEQMIQWDTAGLEGPIDMHLVPAGATDITVVITEIAMQIANTGTMKWIPPKTINVEEVTIILVDAKKVMVISEVFTIITMNVSLPFFERPSKI